MKQQPMQMMPSGMVPQNNMMQHGMMPMKGYEMDPKQLQNFCEHYKNHYVKMQTKDGQEYDGILMESNHQFVDMLVPEGDVDGELDMQERQYGYGYGNPYLYGGYSGYGYGIPRRFRRFRRRRFPFYGIARIFFPFFY